MNESMEQVKSKLHGAADKAKERAHEFGDLAQASAKKSEEAVTGVIDTVKEKVQDVAAGASQMATKAKDTAQEMASDAMEKVGAAGQEIAAVIRRYPVSAMFIALGAGIGVGFLAALAARRA